MITEGKLSGNEMSCELSPDSKPTVDGSSWCPAGAPQPVVSLMTSYMKPAFVSARCRWLSERGSWACPPPQMCQNLKANNFKHVFTSFLALDQRSFRQCLPSFIVHKIYNIMKAAHSLFSAVTGLLSITECVQLSSTVSTVRIHAFKSDKSQLGSWIN